MNDEYTLVIKERQEAQVSDDFADSIAQRDIRRQCCRLGDGGVVCSVVIDENRSKEHVQVGRVQLGCNSRLMLYSS